MPPRKRRIRVIIDTNVIIGFHLSTDPQSANSRVFSLWRDRRELQLVVSDETVAEYFEVLQRHGVPERRIRRLNERLRRRETVTHVGLGARPTASRDPDDNVVLAAAVAGKVKFLITNDHDLLDLPEVERKKFKFIILSPSEFLAHVKSSS